MPVNRKRKPGVSIGPMEAKAIELRTKSKKTLQNAYLLMLDLSKKTGKKIPTKLRSVKKKK